jgi:hypothetical protein
LEGVQPGEAAFDDPTDFAQPGAVGDAAAGDARSDPPVAEQAAVLVEVVAAIGEQLARLAPGPATHAADRRDCVEPGWPQLTGEGLTWSPLGVRERGKRPPSTDPGGACPPREARTGAARAEPARPRPSVQQPSPARHTRAAHQLVRELVPGDTGLSTNTIPVNAAGSPAGLRPGNRCRRGGRSGNSGATRSHSGSGTRSSTTPAA